MQPDATLHPRLPAPDRNRRLAIAEIAGRDSVAAALVAARERGFRVILPTVAFSGTEVGDVDAPPRAVDELRAGLRRDAEVLDPITLGEPRMWSALNARFSSEVLGRFGMNSPCMACHLYMHLCRVPLAWRLGRAPVIAGERDTHGGRVKLSQTPRAIDAAVGVLAHAGIELVEPIRTVESADEIAAIVGDAWEEGGGQLGCVLAGNYVGLDGRVLFDETAYARYVDDFLSPAGVAIVNAWRDLGWDDLTAKDGPPPHEPDYESLVRTVLER